MNSPAGATCPVHVYDAPDALGEALAARIADGIRDANRKRRRFVLGCPGGRSAKTAYRALARRAADDGLDLSGLVIAMMDEYVVPDGDSFAWCDRDAHFSCRRFAREEIRDVLNAGLPGDRRVGDDNVWLPDPRRPDAYDDSLREAGGVDVFLIASGASDGHVAFNPPGTTRESRTRIVELAQTTRRDNLATFPAFAGLEEVPTHGVSVGLGTILDLSREVALILHGANKAAAAERVLSLSEFDPQWPASCIHAASRPRIVLDAAAARGVRRAALPDDERGAAP
jgi:glucosamine-6-phosphate deaminase